MEVPPPSLRGSVHSRGGFKQLTERDLPGRPALYEAEAVESLEARERRHERQGALPRVPGVWPEPEGHLPPTWVPRAATRVAASATTSAAVAAAVAAHRHAHDRSSVPALMPARSMPELSEASIALDAAAVEHSHATFAVQPLGGRPPIRHAFWSAYAEAAAMGVATEVAEGARHDARSAGARHGAVPPKPRQSEAVFRRALDLPTHAAIRLQCARRRLLARRALAALLASRRHPPPASHATARLRRTMLRRLEAQAATWAGVAAPPSDEWLAADSAQRLGPEALLYRSPELSAALSQTAHRRQRARGPTETYIITPVVAARGFEQLLETAVEVSRPASEA